MLRNSILLVLMYAGSVFGQITITKDHMPGSGDAIEFSNARPINVDVSKTELMFLGLHRISKHG